RAREVAPRISDGPHPPAVDGVFTGAGVETPNLDRITASNRGGMIDLTGIPSAQPYSFSRLPHFAAITGHNPLCRKRHDWQKATCQSRSAMSAFGSKADIQLLPRMRVLGG